MSDTKPPDVIWADEHNGWIIHRGVDYPHKYILAKPAEARIADLECKAIKMVARINDQDLEAYEKDDRIKELEAEIERLKYAVSRFIEGDVNCEVCKLPIPTEHGCWVVDDELNFYCWRCKDKPRCS